MVMKVIATLSDDIDIRFAALCHDVGKALTPLPFGPVILIMGKMESYSLKNFVID